MKVVGDFNNISEAIRPKKLAKGDIVTYQLLTGKPDWVDPRKTHYGTWRIPTIDRIWDKGKKAFVDIAVAPKKDRYGEWKSRLVSIPSGSGIIGITGGSFADEELYEFLELCNFNESNPDRDESVEAKFKRIDVVGDAKKGMLKRSVKTEALLYVSNMKEAELREFAAAMNWNENDDLEIIQDLVGEFAETKPEAFTKFFNDPEMKDKALIRRALDKGIISYDIGSHKILWAKTSTVIAALERRDGMNHVDLFSEWVRTTNGGQDKMSGIKKQLNAMIKEANKPVEISE